ncbi:MAG: neutral/alkaline non-lysosomal ceramidase N-terminal domain-containing protein [Candidatus Latescibacterota bacterium]|nr:neutral/alkaline non-lysosomal ceramidase N-terminal domain-containing protein [Candidatus Latescibacterota bacterium]
MTQLRAGISRKTITPPTGIHLMGYGNRIQGNVGAHDDLYVSTVAFYDGESYAAILTADHTFINSVLVKRIKAEVTATTPIEGDAMFLCCSHTHAGPIGYADHESPPEALAYVDDLVGRCADSVTDALAELQTVTLHAGTDRSQININRRELSDGGQIVIGENPEGLVDHEVQVVQLQGASGLPVANLVNYSCHPVVMGPLNRQVSADWVGAMRQGVEDAASGMCLFIQGTPGDINPRKMRWSEDSWDEVEEQGRGVAAAVVRACQQLTPVASGPLRARQQDVWLKLLPARPFDEAFRALVPGITSLEEYHTERQKAFPWHVEFDHREDATYSPVAVGTLRLGDWSLATMATEPFCETGLAIRDGSSAQMTFVSGYTNGCNSYLPVASAYESGGYEVETAPLFYKLPSAFSSESEATVRRAILELLRSD